MSYLNAVVGIIMAIVAMCSIIGNSLVFVVIFWNQSLKKPLNFFLCNLAAADIGISCTCIPYAFGQVAFTSRVSMALSVDKVTLLSLEDQSVMSQRGKASDSPHRDLEPKLIGTPSVCNDNPSVPLFGKIRGALGLLGS